MTLHEISPLTFLHWTEVEIPPATPSIGGKCEIVSDHDGLVPLSRCTWEGFDIWNLQCVAKCEMDTRALCVCVCACVCVCTLVCVCASCVCVCVRVCVLWVQRSINLLLTLPQTTSNPTSARPTVSRIA